MTDFVDPYLYPGTDVLKNLNDIRDPTVAAEFERSMSLLRRRELEVSPVAGNFDLEHLCEIHRRLYQDVWSWAGKLRTVEITKGSSTFHNSELLEIGFQNVHEWLRDSQLLSDTEISEEIFIEQAAELLEKVNYLHPFREGNGRTQRAYLDQIAGISNKYLAWRNVSPLDNERASIRAFNKGSGEPFQSIIQQALEPPLDGLTLLDPQLYRASEAKSDGLVSRGDTVES